MGFGSHRCYCQNEIDVLIIDQADKVGVSGQYNATHERLRELYRRLRELAKRHNAHLLGFHRHLQMVRQDRTDFWS